jgi:hypothetical protein
MLRWGITGHIVGLLGVLISPGGCRFAPGSSPVAALPDASRLAPIGPLSTLGIR